MGPYGQLLHNCTMTWAANTSWRPGKWATVTFLQQAAQDPAYEAEVKKRAEPIGAGSPPPPLSLADLVKAAFDLVLTMFASSLPFGGYWIKVAEQFVLTLLNTLPVPKGVVHR